MKTYPLKSIKLSEALEKQFTIVEKFSKHFNGQELLTLGDLGVVQPINKPWFTQKVEQVIADVFQAEAAKLVVGSGTGAMRNALYAVFQKSNNKNILVHKAPIYPTTKVSVEMLGLKVIEVDFNNQKELTQILKTQEFNCALVQITRQKPDDQYDFEKVIQLIKSVQPKTFIITDDNYAVFKINQIGVEAGADLSTFSTFKLGGPEGIGVVVGQQKLVDQINSFTYSGGSQVQGWQALEVVRGFVNAPVRFAIQAEQCEEIVAIIHKNKYAYLRDAYVVNSQSKVVMVEFKDPIAKDVLKASHELGALANPVGAESKYEITPLFYRASSTFRSYLPNSEAYMIRINPNRAGAKQVVQILERAVKNVSEQNNRKK